MFLIVRYPFPALPNMVAIAISIVIDIRIIISFLRKMGYQDVGVCGGIVCVHSQTIASTNTGLSDVWLGHAMEPGYHHQGEWLRVIV